MIGFTNYIQETNDAREERVEVGSDEGGGRGGGIEKGGKQEGDGI